VEKLMIWQIRITAEKESPAIRLADSLVMVDAPVC
jgi:hypothetical protein